MSSKIKYFVGTSKQGSKMVAAVSSYGGRNVRAVAKCNPFDEFNYEDGKKLAGARCKVRVAERREKRALQKLAEATTQLQMAQKYYDKMNAYRNDAVEFRREAEVELKNVIEDMN